MTIWSDATIRTAMNVVTRTNRADFGSVAMPAICAAVGATITYDALASAFRRKGLDAPLQYCRDNLLDSDDEDEYCQRDTIPSARFEGPSGVGDGGVETILIVPDVHRPYHSKHAWDLMIRAARQLKPDRIVVLGDFVDCYPLSSHGNKDPDRNNVLRSDLEDANRGLDDLDSLDAHSKHFVEGNHEYRLERYINDRCPELFDLLTMPALLRLHLRGWTWTPYRQTLRIGAVNFTHDTGRSGANAAAKARDLYQGNAVIGHVHRAELSYGGNLKGDTHVGASFGWLGDPDAVEYLHKQAVARAWSHAFGVGFHDTKTGAIHMHAVPIINGRCVIHSEPPKVVA